MFEIRVFATFLSSVSFSPRLHFLILFSSSFPYPSHLFLIVFPSSSRSFLTTYHSHITLTVTLTLTLTLTLYCIYYLNIHSAIRFPRQHSLSHCSIASNSLPLRCPPPHITNTSSSNRCQHLEPLSAGHCVLESMVRDPYANYVVQKVTLTSS